MKAFKDYNLTQVRLNLILKIGNALRQLNMAGETQKSLGKFLGCSQSTVGKLIRFNITDYTRKHRPVESIDRLLDFCVKLRIDVKFTIEVKRGVVFHTVHTQDMPVWSKKPKMEILKEMRVK